MNVAAPARLTVDEFLAWSQTQPREAGKFELLDGVVIVQQSQRWRHAQVKFQIAIALRDAIGRARVAYFAAPEGPTVRIHSHQAFEPDALVAALPMPAGDSLEILDPIIVVEVLSPSTAHLDVTVKLKGYFELMSVQHYLLVDPEGATITHHRRTHDDVLETRIVSEGPLTLSPPGITIDVASIFA